MNTLLENKRAEFTSSFVPSRRTGTQAQKGIYAKSGYGYSNLFDDDDEDAKIKRQKAYEKAKEAFSSPLGQDIFGKLKNRFGLGDNQQSNNDTPPPPPPPPTSPSISTGTIIAIVGVSLVVLGTIAYFVFRKK